MKMRDSNAVIGLFSTCPPSSQFDKEVYIRRVIEVAQWSEDAGCKGILVYSDNRQVDPWLLSQVIIENTRYLCPLIAVQPIYTHPYTVAKLVATCGYLYGRRVYLNMVAGGFRNDLIALNDTTPHDRRYDRLVEYTTIVMNLLRGTTAQSMDGEFYKVDKLKLAPPLPPVLMPEIFVSGSSPAGLAAAKALGATAVKYPKPAEEETSPPDDSIQFGIRVGIIARQREEDAWELAHARFPSCREGEIAHQLAMKTSDSEWHAQLSEMAARKNGHLSPYWLFPFETYKTFCPYMVGSYDNVARELARYLALGYETFILDVPRDADELMHINTAFSRVFENVAQ